MSFFEEYERANFWTPAVRGGIAGMVARRKPASALFLGVGTGTNDAIPFATIAPSTKVLATDLDPRMVRLLREGCRKFANVRVEELDLLQAKGGYDAVIALFVLHRLAARAIEGAERVAACVAPGGVLYVSEFVGPRGFIAMCNEPRLQKGIAGRMLARYFERHSFDAALRSTNIAPVRARLARLLRAERPRDFRWNYRLPVSELFRRLRRRAYAPFFGGPEELDDLRKEFEPEFHREIAFIEVIRVHRYSRSV
jgi:SAM-dependent methyltransferase